MRFGYHSITWGGVVGDAPGVTSISNLYYRATGSMDRAIKDIAAAGYQGVEMFDGNVVDSPGGPAQLRELLAEAQLELVSVYSGANFVYADALPDEMARLERAAQAAALAGAGRLVVGGGARRAAGSSAEDYERLGKALDQVVDLTERHGLEASYHPHLGTLAESPEEIERVLGSSRIAFCPDTAHLAAGGGDPTALIRQYRDRLAHVHLKDFRPDPVTFLPLGEGELDFPGILAAVDEASYDSWLMVELDYYDGDPKEAARTSLAHLEKLIA